MKLNLNNSIHGMNWHLPIWTMVLFLFLQSNCATNSQTGQSEGPQTDPDTFDTSVNNDLDEGDPDKVDDPEPYTPVKYALLVGINDYEAVNDLEGCINDVENMKALLRGKFDFQEENILILTDKQATKEGVITAFKTHLIDQAQHGDIVLFHYSGHGSQMYDVNGDETDGWDETLVMQDSRVGDILDLSDDELNSLMTQLCSKTPNVTLILDACHSGTGTKAVAVPRRVERDERRPRNNGQANATKQAQGTSDFRDEDMKYVLISGCTSNQLSYEHYVGEKSYGALSYFLIKELWAATGPVTYRDIMDNVKSKVKAHYSNQYPQLEGANSDQFIFSDSSSLAEAYILVDPYEDDKVTIHVGDIHGVTKGSIFEVYAPNTKKISKQTPIAKVRVMQVKPYKSLGKIMSGKVTKDQSRAVETEHMFSNEKLRVYFTKSRSAKFIKALTKTHDLPFVKEAESEAKSNLIITERSGNIYIGLPSEDVTSHKRFSSNDPHIDVKIAEEVERWAKWFNVLSITNPDPYLDFRLELVSIDPPEGSKGSLDLGKPEYTFSDGEKFEMIITNLSYYDVFIHVLDLEANGNITVLFPDDGAQELLESFGEWRDTVEAYLPPGISKTADVIKVFVTTNGLVNLKFLESAGAGTKGASEYDLENVLITSARPVRPSDAGKSLGLNEWNTTMRVLEVKR